MRIKMMNRLLSVCALTFLLISIVVIPANADGFVPHTTSVKQPTGSNWCWACCNYVILDKYASNPPSWMHYIVHWVHFNHKLQCTPPNNCPFDAPLNRAATQYEARDSIQNWGVPTSLQNNPLTSNGLRSQINNGNMVWCAFEPTSGTGHSVLAVGWSDTLLGDRVKYFEPAEGKDFTITWTSFSSGDFLSTNWDWKASIFDFS